MNIYFQNQDVYAYTEHSKCTPYILFLIYKANWFERKRFSLLSGGLGFEYHPRHNLYWEVFMILLRPSNRAPGYLLNYATSLFTSHPVRLGYFKTSQFLILYGAWNELVDN
jgi:hypothetical protein